MDTALVYDGSCMHPARKNTRFAAFATVLDLCENDAERIHLANQYKGSPEVILSFQVVCTARCQGEQDILRAELSAIVTLAEQVGQGIAHVNSQSAITLAEHALTAASPHVFAACDHTDLLVRLWHVRQQVQLRLVKVKSHQNKDEIEDPLLRYLAMGNNHVDSVANFACKHMHQDLVDQLELVRRDFNMGQKRLEGVFDLHLLLQDQKRAASVNNDGESKVTLHDHRSLCEAYCAWTVDNVAFCFGEVDTRLLESFAFGAEFTSMTVEWARLLRWPEGSEGPVSCNTGIPWIELATSWMVFHRRFLLVIRKDQIVLSRVS
eukprot:s4001_g2.t1